jgi:hypothetical protein
MRPIVALIVTFVGLLHPALLRAQSAPSTPQTSVPRLVQISGVYHPADGQLAAPVESVTVAIYADETGGTPLWQETQSISVDGEGRYSMLLGATEADGVPLDVFASGEARWLELTFAPAAAGDGPRTRLTSVPYALTAGDAVTLGGHPASSYLRAPSAGRDSVATASAAASGAASAMADDPVTPQAVLPGTANALAKYVNGADVGASTISEVSGRLGINTGAALPADYLHVKFNDPFGAFTGLAIQNTSNNANAASGMLFYDHNGVLSQFQGFNNTNHAYVINNIAKNGASQFDGSYNFLIGGASRLFVSTGGNVGIGTTAPTSLLEVSNAASTLPFGQITATTFVNTGQGSVFVGRKARGTSAAPTAVQAGDGLAGYLGQGYGGSAFSGFRGGMFIQAAENWTNTAQGTRLNFNTTVTGTIATGTRMTIDPFGNIGIGTITPTAAVDVVRVGDVAVVSATSFSDGCCAGFQGRTARGTSAAPSAVQLGDALALFIGEGYGTTQFSDEGGGMVVLAAENWTDAAQGSAVAFTTTLLGTTQEDARMVIMPDGKVGIGTFTEFPTLGDKLQVFGDIRVGTTGTNGCINNFAGTGLIGTCSSDRRLKKNITRFGPVLDRLTSLQPVHYFWRASEFPERHFGTEQNYGLIAQDVEQVLPELVKTDSEGFKAVDYSKLPLLTVQAVKELKSENDALKLRIAELERRMTEVLVATGRR